MITAYAAPQEEYISKTTFDLPDGFFPRKNEDGGFFLTNGDEVRGAIGVAWARDAAGRDLETSYSWDGLTLVQTVEVPDDAEFPVVADPEWSYTWTALITIGTPIALRTKMMSCFNCTFPVAGAPAKWPTVGQKLPLTIGIAGVGFPAPCVFAGSSYESPSAWSPRGEFGFWFDADRGHIDSPGSKITFSFWSMAETDPAVKMRFTVFASIKHDNPGGVGRPVYLIGAKGSWGTFMSNVVRTMGGPANPQAAGSYWRWIN